MPCKQLQPANVGRFVAGRRVRASRIEWRADPRAIGAVLAQVDGAGRVSGSVEVNSRSRHPPTRGNRACSSGWRQLRRGCPYSAEREEEVQHLFRLRPDRQVRLSLPIDLTQGEAARLADFVRALGLPEHDDGAVLGIEQAAERILAALNV